MKKFEILRYLKRFSMLIFLLTMAGAAMIYLYAQGKQPLQAAAAAVYVHASAADELIHHMDAYSIQPNDLITALSGIYGKLKNK